MNFFGPRIAPAATVVTPCIGICTLRPDGLCAGCLRSGPEIAGWSALSDAERLRFMAETLAERRK